MGWTFQHKENGMTVKEFFQKEFYCCDILQCKVVNFNEVYMAVRSKKDLSRIFALVCIIKNCRSEYHNYGYKDMDETMHPYYYNCPESILDMLSETTDARSLEWRKYCRERINKKKAVVLMKGSIIRFEKPIVNDGEKELRIISTKPLRVQGVNNGNFYRLSRSVLTNSARKFEIISKEKV